MTTRRISGYIVMVCCFAMAATAAGRADLQKYFNEASIQVKAADKPSEKRRILNESLHHMSTALNMIQGSTSLSQDDAASIDRFKATLQEKRDELAGTNGFMRVPDEQLNAFSDYVVQDTEQAAEMITISVVTLLLIIILIVLLV